MPAASGSHVEVSHAGASCHVSIDNFALSFPKCPVSPQNGTERWCPNSPGPKHLAEPLPGSEKWIVLPLLTCTSCGISTYLWTVLGESKDPKLFMMF